MTISYARSSLSCLDVVVIGGGCFGVSVAYHLGKLSKQNNLKTSVVLFEKSELTAGSTWHAAGLVTYFHPGINMKKVHYDSLTLYHELFDDNLEFKSSFHTPGSLRLATTAARWQEMHYQMNRYYACTTDTSWIDDGKVRQRLISPEEIRAMCPIVDCSDIIGGLYTQGDGHIDPNSLTSYMAQLVTQNFGVQIKLNSPISAISYDSGQRLWNLTIKSKRTDDIISDKTYKARNVVNCAGLWAHEVNKLVGIPVTPLVPINHQYLITEPLPNPIRFLTPPDNSPNHEKDIPRDEIAVIRDLEGSYYLRQERNAILLGPYENPNSMCLKSDWIEHGVPEDFGKQLFEPDVSRLTPHLEMALKRFPVLNEIGIKVCVHGPIMYTPDVLPLVGPVQGQPPGYWIAAGSGYGIAHAGGIGKYLAEWILSGEPPYDLIECDPDRFRTDKWADRSYVFAKARESYGLNNALYFSKEQRIAGRPTRRLTKLAKFLAQKRGAVMGFNNGWEQPLYFLQTGYDGTNELNSPEGSDYLHYLRRNTMTQNSFTGSDLHYYGTPPNGSASDLPENWFACTEREVTGLKSGLGFVDLTPFGKFLVAGKEATRFLDETFANSLPKVGKTKIAHTISPISGNVYSEMTITRLASEEYFLVTGAGSELHDFRWLEDRIRHNRYDCEMHNVTDEFGVLGFAGPLAHRFVTDLFEMNQSSENQVAANLSKAPLQFMDNKRLDLRVGSSRVPVTLIRISYTGEFGYELYYPIDKGLDVYLKCLETATRIPSQFPNSKNSIVDFGSYAMNSLRIEKGFRAWSHEMNMDRNLFEAQLTLFLKLDKEVDFVGKHLMQRLSATFYENPRNKVLRFLTLEKPMGSSTVTKCNSNDKRYALDDIDLEGNESIWHGDQCVGFTTSGAYSFTIGKHIAFAFLPLNICESLEKQTGMATKSGTELYLNYMDNFYECAYSKEPLVKTAEILALAAKREQELASKRS